MEYPIAFGLTDASEETQRRTAERLVDSTIHDLRPELIKIVQRFLASPISPMAFFTFELAVSTVTRQFGRRLLDLVMNVLEPKNAEMRPSDMWFECGEYRRRSEKTRNGHVATLFGTVTLWQRGSRSWERSEGSIFPVERGTRWNHAP